MHCCTCTARRWGTVNRTTVPYLGRFTRALRRWAGAFYICTARRRGTLNRFIRALRRWAGAFHTCTARIRGTLNRFIRALRHWAGTFYTCSAR